MVMAAISFTFFFVSLVIIEGNPHLNSVNSKIAWCVFLNSGVVFVFSILGMGFCQL